MLVALQSWFAALFGVVDEPTTMLTDYLIALAAIGFATSVARSLPSHQARWKNFWVLGFVSVSMAAGVGGTMHGFASSVGEVPTRLMSDLTGLLILATATLFIVAAFSSRIPPPAGRWLVAGLAVTVVGAGVLTSRLVLVPAFTRVDLYHCIQLVGLFCFCRGARQVRHGAGQDRKRQLWRLLGRFSRFGRPVR